MLTHPSCRAWTCGGRLLTTALASLAMGSCQRIEAVEVSGPSSSSRDPSTPIPAPTQDDDGPTETSEDEPDPSWFPDLPPGFGDPGLVGCDKVDILFVIDNSTSMATEQSQLVGSFPSFISHVEEYLVEENDYHIGVVTTDAYVDNDPACRELGALVTRTATGNCGPYAAGNFITADDDLESAFSCAAMVGVDGDLYEHQIEAALRAVGPDLAGEGGCNHGFIRDDALLVLVVISDEDDAPPEVGNGSSSPGGPADWFEEMAALKGGEENVVALALVGREPPNACDGLGLAKGGSEPGLRIGAFAAAFSFHLWGDVCESSYGGSFAETLSIIADACEEHDPTP